MQGALKRLNGQGWIRPDDPVNHVSSDSLRNNADPCVIDVLGVATEPLSVGPRETARVGERVFVVTVEMALSKG